ncbi:hypothetical protein E4656_08240 [Natronospirillum operosum]|uniref:Peptidase C-terminal archaeal/bacterial domain-containing protein n=1 Tax=Natronospirillum operosum TaxID=2759953 RepID=A0A4Z0WG49_9GAMM|nr:hypothetical protein [Natronospirillum operosum]TGG94151.1 hypothetical protein E4656_08240 [Natronospirillum operosum]
MRLRTFALLSVALFFSLGCASVTPSSADQQHGFAGPDSETLTLDETRVGELGRSAPVNPRDGAPYRVYQIDLDGGDLIALNVSSSDFYPGISLYAPDGSFLAHESAYDDWGWGGDEATVTRRIVTSGRYVLVVSASESGNTGTFELSAERLQEAGDLDVPGQVSGFLARGDGSRHPNTGAAVQVFPFELSQSEWLDMRLESNDFDAYLTLVEAGTEAVVAENDDWGGSTDSRILAELDAGAYELWVTGFHSESSGRFTLRVEETSVSRPDPLSGSGTVTGMLSEDRMPIGGFGVTGNPHTLSVDEPVVIDLSMHSYQVDPYLYVLDENDQLVGEDDDSAGSLDARLVMPLEPGEYTIWASSFYESDRGDYELVIDLYDPSDFDGDFIGDYIMGDSTSGGYGTSGSSGCGCGGW